MTPLLKKLNYKSHAQIVVINCPPSFAVQLDAMAAYAPIVQDLKDAQLLNFVLCFVTELQQIESFVTAAMPKLTGDFVLWMCYPKMSSKNYNCNFNRDSGWQSLGAHGLEPVRIVAIDNDFSALRFRQVGLIKTITRRRSAALTTEAKSRTTQKDS